MALEKGGLALETGVCTSEHGLRALKTSLGCWLSVELHLEQSERRFVGIRGALGVRSLEARRAVGAHLRAARGKATAHCEACFGPLGFPKGFSRGLAELPLHVRATG